MITHPKNELFGHFLMIHLATIIAFWEEMPVKIKYIWLLDKRINKYVYPMDPGSIRVKFSPNVPNIGKRTGSHLDLYTRAFTKAVLSKYKQKILHL